MTQEINFREVIQLRWLADTVELRHVNGVPSAILPIPLTLADDKVQRYIVTGSKAEIEKLLEIEPAHDQAPTDLSKRLRDAATADVAYLMARLLVGAADEIERYYGGMMAWKRAAEAKDRAAQAQPADACTVPPPGWYCTRAAGHEGPCAAHPADLAGSEGGNHD